MLRKRRLADQFKSLSWVRRRFNPSFLLPGFDPDASTSGYEGEEGYSGYGRAGVDTHIADAVARRIEQWASGKDIYDMIESLESLGLHAEVSTGGGTRRQRQPTGDEEACEEEEEGGGEQGVQAEAAEDVASERDAQPLDRDTATVAQLTAAFERASRSLGKDRVAELPEEKRAVASELSRALAAAYEAERIVLEECDRAQRGRQEDDM